MKIFSSGHLEKFNDFSFCCSAMSIELEIVGTLLETFSIIEYIFPFFLNVQNLSQITRPLAFRKIYNYLLEFFGCSETICSRVSVSFAVDTFSSGPSNSICYHYYVNTYSFDS